MAGGKRRTIHLGRIEEMRAKIRSTLLIKRLEDHSLTTINDPELASKTMTDSQVRAALGLLAKVLPNVSETKTEISGPDGGGIPVNLNVRFK